MILNRVVIKVFIKILVFFEESKGVDYENIWEESILGRENSKCEGEVGLYLIDKE